MDISSKELEVMQAVWEDHPVNANDIVNRLNRDGQWHEKTVKTLLGRLVKKQALSFDKDGRQYIYHPLIARHEYQQKESRGLLQRLFKGRLSPFVAAFARENTLKQEDIDDLKKIIADWEKKHD